MHETDAWRPQDESPPDLAIASVAARQHGVVTLAQIETAGLGRRAAGHRISLRRLRRIHRGVYATGHAPLTFSGRSLAAALAVGDGAVVSHLSAAVIWGLLTDFGAAIDVSVARHRTSRPGINVHCVRRLDSADTTYRDRIPVTTVPRTLLDLADTASEPALRRATRLAQVDHKTDEDAIRAQLERAGGRRGAHRLAALISDGPAPTRSEFEDRILALIGTHDLPRPVVNAVLRNAQHTFEVDFLFPEQRVVVEADGRQFHDDRLSRRRDAAKQAVLEASGFRVIRLTWDQVKDHPAQTIRRIRRLLG